MTALDVGLLIEDGFDLPQRHAQTVQDHGTVKFNVEGVFAGVGMFGEEAFQVQVWITFNEFPPPIVLSFNATGASTMIRLTRFLFALTMLAWIRN